MLDPKGYIAIQERNIILLVVAMGLTIIIPTLLLLFSTAWKYREENTRAKYSPDAVNNWWRQALLWSIPVITICILAVITWKTTHELDPYKQIASRAKPLHIEVVALRWKWLFIYPDQHIATINYLRFPVNTPITVSLTADNAPMNSFWIPGLVGQMYAMTGMSTPLHFLSNNVTTFTGSAAEISGQGFADMRFKADAISRGDFEGWVKSVQEFAKPLDAKTYEQLTQPSEDNPVTLYSSVDGNLYNMIMMKYMAPTKTMDMN